KPEQFQVWMKGRLIAQFPKRKLAELMAQRLKQFFYHSSNLALKNAAVEPAFSNRLPVVKVGDRILYEVAEDLAKDLDRNGELIAIEWANNLRMAIGQKPLELADAQKKMHNLVETQKTFEGLASWYGPYFHGRVTATGETYNQHKFTAAHPSLPFDTYLKVENLENGHDVIVRINDRGPYVSGRTLDLSQEAVRCLNGEKAGLVSFKAVIMQPSSN
ncbi:MAG TPA: septal ring lytic transglycosylase RlpA family protein, partial [Cyanophyceae cyanobacterium]